MTDNTKELLLRLTCTRCNLRIERFCKYGEPDSPAGRLAQEHARRMNNMLREKCNCPTEAWRLEYAVLKLDFGVTPAPPPRRRPAARRRRPR